MTTVVGGILHRVNGALRAVSARLEDAPALHCWRCGVRIFADEMRFAPGTAEHPIVVVCRGCLSDDDREALNL